MKNLCYHILLTGFLGFWMQAAISQNIPGDRLVDWSVAGLLEEIEDPELLLSVTDFGAAGNGISDDSEAVLAAIEATEGQIASIYFPAGTYLLTQPIYFHTGLCLKGAGADQTHLKFTLSSDNYNCLNISSSQNNSFIQVLDGFYFSSTNLVLMDGSGINPGDFVEIRQENGSWDSNPASWAANSVGQIIEVLAVNGNEIELKDPLRISYDEDLNPEIRKINQIENIKIENLSIERTDEPIDGGGKNIYLSYAVNVQISGIESKKSQGSHIYITRSSHIFAFGNYIHDAFEFDGTATRGYGVTLNMHTGNSLIENNIFRNLRHAMMVKTGANGNVFSYNYSREPHRSEPISNYSGDISVHGHYAYANLFEENIVQNLFIDHYWGPGGPLNTFLRNRTELFGIVMTTNNGMETNSQNFIGNEISGNFPYGLYIMTGEDHFEFGNNDGGNCIPANTTNVTDESYFYNEAPWFLDDVFPTIGYPNELNEHIIPAKERWLNGENLVMEYNPNTVGQEELPVSQSGIQLLKNPVQDQLVFLMNEPMESFGYRIYSTHGQLVHSGNPDNYSSGMNINIRHLTSGTYILRLETSSKNESFVFVKK